MTGGYRPFDGDSWLDRELPLGGGPYQVLPESAFDVAEEMAFARQGRKARVFKLLGPDGQRHALKTFYRGFSLPEYGPITQALRDLDLGGIPGLRACQRRLVDDDEATAIGEPGLTYAVLMPWIEGVAWAAVVEERFPLAEETCLALANQTVAVLAELESRHFAHADVSSSNVLITHSEQGPSVELIDVEDMYHEAFASLPYVPDGSPGYAHPGNHGRGCRNRFGDRFASAILLTEMLVWPDPAVRESAADISVFDQGELCRDSEKLDLVRKVLLARSAQLVRLFERAWHSTGPADCPRLAEWAKAMATLAPTSQASGPPTKAAEADQVRGQGGAEPTPAQTPGQVRDQAPDPASGPDQPVNRERRQETEPDHPHAVACPGCRRRVPPRHRGIDHAATCPLRPLATGPAANKSTFPGVPTYHDIGFVPLFRDDQP